MEINHKNIFFTFDCPEYLKNTFSTYTIKKIKLSKVKARLVKEIKNNLVTHKKCLLNETPHWKFLNGKKEDYAEYLSKFTWAVGLEHSVENYEELIKKFSKYLDVKYNKNYIIVRKEQEEYFIIDGLHRSCILLNSGEDEILAVVLDDNADQLETYFQDFKDSFLEWYTPIKINEKLIINERTYPNFVERPDYLTNKERGFAKWEYIIEKNLPDLNGKTVCDIGCSVGLFDYLMIKKGAKKVDGYDRSEQIVQPTNINLPRQSVVQQAYFIKNLLELRDSTKYDNINFFEYDINQADFTKFNYDIFFSTCVLYHFGENFEKFIKDISLNHKFVFLQTNLGHTGGTLAKYASVEYHKYLLEKYGYSVIIDAPSGYKYPVIIGSKA